MRSQVFKYLTHYSTQPQKVDRLIVSAFLAINRLRVKKNEFLKSFLIQKNKKKEYSTLQDFILIIKTETPKFEFEELIELFEFVISPADRVVNGAIYTPLNIRDYIIKHSFHSKRSSLETVKIADIACGCGGFLFNASRQLKKETRKTYFEIYETQIFGLDIQKYSTTRTKVLLTLLALWEGEDKKEFPFNIFTADALDFDWQNALPKFSGFDIILGNPPYVCSRYLTAETKIKLRNWDVCKSGHPDLYIPFFQIGMENLATDGVLGFITMNSFFKSLNGRSLRAYFQKSKYKFQIVDFGTVQVFKKKSTYTCICIIQKSQVDNIEYSRVNEISSLDRLIEFRQIPYVVLKSYDGWNLQNFELINRIKSVGQSFSKKYKTRNGIATLKNEIYIFRPVSEDSNFYYLQNGNLYPIEKEICKSIINPNKLTTQKDLETFTEKIIFPYEFNDEEAEVLTAVQLKSRFPYAMKYLNDKREDLSKRDYGLGDYEKWFAFGRTQSLEKMRHKLFFPHITPHIPNYVINSDENLLFYNGIAVIGKNEKELRVLSKLMSSRLFWFYLKNTSKPYSAGYISMSKNYIKNFGIYDFSVYDIEYILKEKNMSVLNEFIEEKYQINFNKDN